MLYAYCDESYTGDINTTPQYVVAGFIGEADAWEEFDRLWRRSMKDLGIRKIGCHAAKCNNGSGPYKHMSRERRNEIQWRLIVDIAAARPFGTVSSIDMNAYRAYSSTFSRALVPEDRQYNVPHALAVRQCVQHMCLVTEAATREPITFVVDQNQKFGKRAKTLYEVSRANPDNTDGRHAPRLGPFSEGDRLQVVGLQAADMLAWAAMRNTIGTPGWQWEALSSAVKIGRPFTSGDKFWSDVAEFSPTQLEEKVEA